jgi:hypothetical protein
MRYVAAYLLASLGGKSDPSASVLSGESTNTNFGLWFDLIGAGTNDLQHTYHYTNDAAKLQCTLYLL